MELSKEKLIERAELTDEDLSAVTGGTSPQDILGRARRGLAGC